MKKLFYLLTAMLLLLPLGSCKKGGGETLEGTKWTLIYSGIKYILEFPSKTDVRLFEADENNNVKSGLCEDTYSFADETVTFDKKSLRVMKFSGSVVTAYYFQDATVSKEEMRIRTKGVEAQVDISEGMGLAKETQGVYLTFRKL